MIAFATLVTGFRRLALLRGRAVGPGFHLATGIYRRIVERIVLARLARLSPHLLSDMGFSPEEVRAAANGEMGVAEPFRLRLVRRQHKAEEARSPARFALNEISDVTPTIVSASCVEAAGGKC